MLKEVVLPGIPAALCFIVQRWRPAPWRDLIHLKEGAIILPCC